MQSFNNQKNRNRMDLIVSYLPLFGVLALIFVFWKNMWVAKQEEGNETDEE